MLSKMLLLPSEDVPPVKSIEKAFPILVPVMVKFLTTSPSAVEANGDNDVEPQSITVFPFPCPIMARDLAKAIWLLNE